ncbi:MAG: hypothetical protein M0021_12845 [Clostridia bacterium]|nr:hypothetical protein [Clostridia bacterium]
MTRKNKADFPMNPALKRFQYEVASEIGITGLGEQQVDVLAKTDLSPEQTPGRAAVKGQINPGRR